MKPLAPIQEKLAQRIAELSAPLGQKLLLDAAAEFYRGDDLVLAPPGRWSPNGACQLVQARDGWIALNLPREDDLASIPALLQCAPSADAWADVARDARNFPRRTLVERAELLGLPLAAVGERAPMDAPCAARVMSSASDAAARHAPLRVIDLSALWAGPLCGAILARAGAEVRKIESRARPDPTAQHTPHLDQRLNGLKAREVFDHTDAEARRWLFEQIARSDVLITSARVRALVELGLDFSHAFAANPRLVWVAVTGHGIGSNRVGFGDDAAAAGGLVAWEDGAPAFLGDALADPLTGLAAAAAAMQALSTGGGALIDADLAGTAAFAAGALAQPASEASRASP